MRSARFPLLVVSAALAPVVLRAEPLDLAEAMRRARGANPAVAAATARAEAAAARERQARGFRLPSVRLEESFVRTDSPAEVFALTLNQERFSLASLMQGDPNHPDALDTAITRLEVSLPLFTGGELSGRIEQAEEAARSAAASGTWAADQAAGEAGQAFIQLAQAREMVELLTHSRETVAAHVELARSYVEQGMTVRSELLRAEVELARMDDILAEAEGNAAVAAANLAFRLGADQNERWELEPLPAPPAVAGEPAEWLEAAARRSDLEAARAMLRAGELEEKVRRAAFLPRVGLLARGDLVDDTPFGRHGDSTAIMAQASLNLFAGGSDRAALAAARFEARAGAADVRRFEQGIALEVRQAYEAARTAASRHRTAERALAAAREAERITTERFRTGIVKMLDLLDATTARRDAETRELVARAEAHGAAIRLAVASARRPEDVLAR